MQAWALTHYTRKKRALTSKKGESSRYHLYSHIPMTHIRHRFDAHSNLSAVCYSLLKPVVNSSPPVPVQPSCSKATFNTHCSKRSSSCQTALSEEILYLLLFLATFSILYIIITTKIFQARISTTHAPDTFFLSEKAAVPHPHSRFFLPYI